MIYESYEEIPQKFFEDIPVLIPTFNQLTYCKNTISRLQDFKLFNFIILDNGSTYEPFLEWAKEIEYPVVIRYDNPGPRDFFINMSIWNRLPNIFIVTDPDLEYPSSIPDSVIQDMINITHLHRWPKIALGLNTDPEDLMYPMVKDWEAAYWTHIVGYTESGDPIYNAKTDTTFALYNKEYVREVGDLSWNGSFFNSPRICGNYLINHLGWYIEKNISDEERDFYENTASWWASTSHEIKRRNGL